MSSTQEDDNDDAYSFDDDFASTSQDERLRSSSICEESENNGSFRHVPEEDTILNVGIEQQHHVEHNSGEGDSFMNNLDLNIEESKNDTSKPRPRPNEKPARIHVTRSFDERVNFQPHVLKTHISIIPRCAYLSTKCTSNQRNATQQHQEKPAKVVRYSKRRLDELAKPHPHHIYRNKNLHPNTANNERTQKQKSTITSTAIEERQNFLDRMDIMAKRRKENLERAAAEALYDAKVDKKKCPKCGTTQSFDEMAEGRNKCPNDGCKNICYQYPNRFVLKNFEKRMQRSQDRRILVLDGIREEQRISISQPSFQKSRRQKELLDKVSKEGKDFIGRMERDVGKRKDKIYQLEEMGLEIEKKVCTFQPKLNVKEHLIQARKGGLSSLAAPLRRNTEEYPLVGKTRKKKTKKKRRKPLESPWQQSNQKKNSTKQSYKSGNGQKKNSYNEELIRSKFQKMIM